MKSLFEEAVESAVARLDASDGPVPILEELNIDYEKWASMSLDAARQTAAGDLGRYETVSAMLLVGILVGTKLEAMRSFGDTLDSLG